MAEPLHRARLGGRGWDRRPAAVNMAAKVSFADDFFEEISALSPSDYKRVMTAVDDLRKNPDSQGLRLKAMRGGLKGLMSIRAAQDLRVLLERRGNTFIILTGGSRQDVYEKAERGRLLVNPNTGYIGFVTPEPASAEQRTTPAPPKTVDRPRPFDHWADAELDALDMGDGFTVALRSLESEDDFFDLDLTGEQQAVAIDILELTPEAWAARRAATPEEEVRHAAEDEARLVDTVNRFGALAGLSPFLADDELERLFAAPIEDWMLFLHPDQRSVVDREFSGPARIRGSAGTGKTVVVLHRSAELARRYDPATNPDGGRILVTTFINSLPPVLEHLYRRLPTAPLGLVDFTNVDKLAYRICRDAGQAPTIDPRAVDAAKAAAWKQIRTPGSPLARLGVTDRYAAEEVAAVIKGRGLDNLDSYLNTKRTGRKLQLPEAARRQLWDYARSYDEALASRGVLDFPDIILRARDIARRRTEPLYRAALVDEAQDLTLAGLQLIRALVNGPGSDRPDGLFLAGDGAQRIYPGGFTLRQAGVEVRGRTSVLRVNYRNTAEVLDVAVATTGADEIEDLDEQFTRADDAGDTTRRGERPQLLVTRSDTHQREVVAATVDALVGDDTNGIGSGDIAVLCPTNKASKAMREHLKAAHVPTIDLNDYDGVATESVKVGTQHRVKGLEFKAVILTDLSDGVFPRPRPSTVTEDEFADQMATTTAVLFVAMTRARDRLVLTCVDAPSPLLEGAIDRLDLIEAP